MIQQRFAIIHLASLCHFRYDTLYQQPSILNPNSILSETLFSIPEISFKSFGSANFDSKWARRVERHSFVQHFPQQTFRTGKSVAGMKRRAYKRSQGF